MHNHIFILLCSILLILYFMSVINIISSGYLLDIIAHKFFKWHVPTNEIEDQFRKQVSTCRFCKKQIIRYRGDWFIEEDDGYVKHLRK